MYLTILNRIDIDIDWGFSSLSLGFHIGKRSLGLSLLFIDISIWYISPERRAEMEKRFAKFSAEEDQA